MKNKEHEAIRNKVEDLLSRGLSIGEIASQLRIPVGTRYIRETVNWYRYCIIAKQNQKKAIEKHPNLYSEAGKIAQQKHPGIGRNLGKKYGAMGGKIASGKLKKIQGYYSKLAKRLQEINPEHSRLNMRKAHETMKREGTFKEHQRLAALKCKEKNPNQLKEMSKKAHELHPLALLALESRRKNYPFRFMNCLFDSNEEMLVCQKLVEQGLIDKPIDKVNIHFPILKKHIDFFIRNKVFLEFHPPIRFGNKKETSEGYYLERRMLLDTNGFSNYPLVLINNVKEVNQKLQEIKSMLQFH